jgi:hypothetical protein
VVRWRVAFFATVRFFAAATFFVAFFVARFLVAFLVAFFATFVDATFVVRRGVVGSAATRALRVAFFAARGAGGSCDPT